MADEEDILQAIDKKKGSTFVKSEGNEGVSNAKKTESAAIKENIAAELSEVIALRLIYDRPGEHGVPPGGRLQCAQEKAEALVAQGLACWPEDGQHLKLAATMTSSLQVGTSPRAPGRSSRPLPTLPGLVG